MKKKRNPYAKCDALTNQALTLQRRIHAYHVKAQALGIKKDALLTQADQEWTRARESISAGTN